MRQTRWAVHNIDLLSEQLTLQVADLQREVEDLRRYLDEQRSRDVETLALASRHRSTGGGPRRVVILVHNADAWDSVAGVYDELRSRDDFEVIVASIPRAWGGYGEFAHESVTHHALAVLGVDHLRWGFEDPYQGLRLLKQLDPDVVFRQGQWDADVQAGYAAHELAFTRIAYIPYELLNHIENVQRGEAADSAVDEPLLRYAWRVFCANELVKQQAARGSAVGASRWRVTGHPKVDRLRGALPVWPCPDRVSGVAPRVLYSAHHSIDDHWTRFGKFPWVADKLIDWAREREDVDFVFSPHPALPTSLAANERFREVGERFDREWAELPNTAVLNPGDGYVGAFAAADVILTDGLSAQMEGQVLGKPVVWMEREGHRPFNPAGEVVTRGLHIAPSFTDARRTVERLLTEPDELAPRQREVVAELFGQRGAATRIVDELQSALDDESRVSRGS